MHMAIFSLYSLFILAFVYFSFNEMTTISLILLCSTVVAYFIYFLFVLNRSISKISFSNNHLLVNYQLGRMKSIPYQNIHTFNFHRCTIIKILYIDDRKATFLRLKHFDKEAIHGIFQKLNNISKHNISQLTQEEIDSLQDKNKFNFEVITDHGPSFYSSLLLSSLLPMVGIFLVAYDCVQARNLSHAFSSIDFGVATSFILPIAVILFDKMMSKKLLALKDGVLTLSNEFTVLKKVNLLEASYFYIDWRSIKWSTADDPQTIHTIHLMCYRPRKRCIIARNVKAVISDI